MARMRNRSATVTFDLPLEAEGVDAEDVVSYIAGAVEDFGKHGDPQDPLYTGLNVRKVKYGSETYELTDEEDEDDGE